MSAGRGVVGASGAARIDAPRREGSDARLVACIRDEILAAPQQRITFARYMQLALTEPELGYYATSDLRPTRSGDFLTAPELHPFFGRCLGRFLAAAWQQAGSAPRFVVQEHGAGRGTLRRDALAGLAADGSDLRGAIDWQALDLPWRSATWPDPASRPAGPASPAGLAELAPRWAEADVVVANELLDALPVHRVVEDGRLLEAFVTWQEGWFREVVDEPSSPALAEHLAAAGVSLAEGQRAEICLAAPAWLAAVADTADLILVIDYGHPADELYGPARVAGTLLTYRGQRVDDDPYAAVGRTDITAHVDITALERAASAAGLVPLASTTQGRFLAALGLADLLVDLGRDPGTTLPTYLAARSAVARLIDPRQLGGFRVLAWARPGSALSSGGLPGLSGPA